MTQMAVAPSGILVLINDGTVEDDKFAALAQAYLGSFTEVIRQKTGAPRDKAWPDNVNYVFRNIARMFTGGKRIIDTAPYSGWLYFEPDLIPLKPHWKELLNQMYDTGKRPFMGVKSKVNATKSTGEKLFLECMNGAGVYPFESVHYSPQMMLTDNIPWDVAGLSLSAFHKITFVPDSAYILTYGVTKCHKNSEGTITATKTLQDGTIGEIAFKLGDAILHHGCKDESLLDIICGIPVKTISKQPDEPPVPRIQLKRGRKPKERPVLEPRTYDEQAIIADYKANISWHELVGKYRINPGNLKKILAPYKA